MGGQSLNGVSGVQQSSSVAPSNSAAAAPLVRRFSSVDLDAPVRGPKPKLFALDLATTPDIEKKLAKLEGRTISRPKLEEYTAVKSGKTSNEVETARFSTALDPAQAEKISRMNINNLMNKVIKKSIDNDPSSVKNQSQMAQVLADNINPVLDGLKRVTTPAANKIKLDLTHQGKLLTTEGIEKLLNSKNPVERSLGEKAMKALSKLCEDSTTLNAAIRKNIPSPALSGHTVDPIQVQSQFIKAARSVISNEYFEHIISRDLQRGVGNLHLSGHVLQLPKPLESYIANVGFNRLMSENNFMGASLSSDVDFKLVLDDENIRTDLTAKLTKELLPKLMKEGKTETQAKEIIGDMVKTEIGDIKKKINEVLKASQTKLESGYNMTLEVATFTVKTISDLKEQASTSEVEQNFLATVLHNHSFMSGNEVVKDKFINIIRDNLQFSEIAVRNFAQNLGDSDKGSIKAIKNLTHIENTVNITADTIANDDGLRAKFIAELRTKIPKDKDLTALVGSRLDSLASDPVALAALIKEKPALMKSGLTHDIKHELLANPLVSAQLGRVDMFSDVDVEEKLALTFKLTGTFTKDINGSMSRDFIGRTGIQADSDWIFSVKYAGCRLNDTFDATPKSVFILNDGRDIGEVSKLFDSAQKIGEAINTFSIQIQNRTYEAASASGKSHAEIDEVYDRLTANEFASMAKNPEMMPKLKTMMNNLVADLGTNLHDVVGDDVKAIKEVQSFFAGKSTSQISALPASELRELGHKLFTALFNVADKTANQLQPQPIAAPAPHTHSATV
jgi:hypothetical protein